MQIIPVLTTNQKSINYSSLLGNKKNLNFKAVNKKATVIKPAVIGGATVVLGLNKTNTENNKTEEAEKEKVLKTIKPIISRIIGENEKNIKPESHLENDLGCDSIDEVEIIQKAEEKFGIKIKDRDVEEMNSVQDLVNVIYHEVEEKQQL